MGCCLMSQVTQFPKVEDKSGLKKSYSNEINRVKLLKNTIRIDPNKQDDYIKIMIIEKILHEDNWVILPLVESCAEEHVKKLKFLLDDYFQVTDNWNRKDFEDHFIKLMNFYKDNSYNIQIVKEEYFIILIFREEDDFSKSF